MGLDVGMEMLPLGAMSSTEAAATSFPGAYFCGLPTGCDPLRIDELLDFSGEDDDSIVDFGAAATVSAESGQHQLHGHLPQHEPSGVAGAATYSLSTEDFYIPREEAAELEWLSKFVDDSFSDVPFTTSGLASSTAGGEGAAAGHSSHCNAVQLMDQYASNIPGRARSKRSKAPTATLHGSTITTAWSFPPPPASPSSSSVSEVQPSHGPAVGCKRKGAAAGFGGARNRQPEEAAAGGGARRRCTHCASEKTPQWRTGPLGPKTLCNACGVRYKSGRLVPEYRPAASPTFVLTQHSNSHRKVVELRRQKELLLRHQVAGGSGARPAASASSSPSARPRMALFCDHEAR